MKFLKFLLGIISIILCVGYGQELGKVIYHLDIKNHNLLLFLFGFAIFIPLWILLLNRVRFLCVFEHEFTHMVATLMCFRKPVHFRVGEKDGEVGYSGSENFFITLAPYFLPTITCLLVPFYFVIKPNLYPWYFVILGLTFSYHILSNMREFSYAQPDIVKSGRIFSTVFLIFTNILVTGLIVTFVVQGFGGCWVFLKNGFLLSVYGVGWTINELRSKM